MHDFIPNDMKKILVLITLVAALSITSHAQFLNYGVRGGVGFATHVDDLAFNTPILAANIGGFVSFGFTQSQSLLAENFYLQTGLNLIRRGSNFREVLEMAMSIREGYYDAWYAQIPVLATFHYELPIRSSGHVVGLFIGPAVSYGLFGRYGDRKITPGVTSPTANYDVNFNGSKEDRQVFNHLNRLDVSAILGISYEYKHLRASFYIDHGFMATSEGDDILRILENGTSNKVNVKIPNGNNVSYMLSVGYSLGSFVKE